MGFGSGTSEASCEHCPNFIKAWPLKGRRKTMNKEHRSLRVLPFAVKTIRKYLVVALALALLAGPASVAPVISAPKTLQITLLYTTAETSTSAAVVWNTNTASDSLL